MYDFANSGFTTVVLTAVFNAYFVGVVAGNAPWATLAWTAALALSSLLVIVTVPGIGAYADAHARKKRLLLFSTIGCVLGTAALGLAQPGTVAWALVAIVVANYFFSIGDSLIAAFLPELARPHALGKVSGWGWSFGYFGGMLALGLSLAYVLSAKAAGRPAAEFVPVTMWITAGIYALAAVPVFALLRERAQPQLAVGGSTPQGVASGAGMASDVGSGQPGGVVQALTRLRRSWRDSARFADLRRLLWCGACYQAGIAVVIALAAVYAEQVMQFTQTQTMALIFVVNIASVIGAFSFGYAQDRLGHKRALAVTLLGWIAMVLVAGLGTTLALFWLAAVLAGLCMGSSQSCGRAMVGALTPASRLAEFFGLWTLAGRVAAIVGPLTYGLVTWLTVGNHRLAILVTGLFFVLGLLLLARIDIGRGQAAAQAAAA
ncbi:MAG: MFS transporter [Burkholderiales bacterium]|nr:MFS transporter [Burkholderiales bacterium]